MATITAVLAAVVVVLVVVVVVVVASVVTTATAIAIIVAHIGSVSFCAVCEAGPRLWLSMFGAQPGKSQASGSARALCVSGGGALRSVVHSSMRGKRVACGGRGRFLGMRGACARMFLCDQMPWAVGHRLFGNGSAAPRAPWWRSVPRMGPRGASCCTQPWG